MQRCRDLYKKCNARSVFPIYRTHVASVGVGALVGARHCVRVRRIDGEDVFDAAALAMVMCGDASLKSERAASRVAVGERGAIVDYTARLADGVA
jgi:hypothetical protein